ncbi:TPA: TIGR03757 family integrating conjugative element protein [Escherichia coli]|nr:TIGR03757 family integrating conjugative element protein [Escherichia coli]MBB7083128.1 TIGR03757 family integrating conjugative element protein [Escherichia coli]HBN7234540.1 TIGR03757 family integrating conjugative element protein [Escherichia coli]HBQ4880337.1 TIGR03757 family integrating conjugative element protein [Escherichia coli]
MHRILLSSLFFLPMAVSAGITLYTDTQHLPVNPPADVRVILLDGPEQLQARFFGALPADSREAEAIVRARMQSPEWGPMQAELADRYREVAKAWSLGVKKYPAVVFDDHEVVYGTTDVAEAVRLRAQQGGLP